MNKLGIFYGSSTGDTEYVAKELLKHFDGEDAKAFNIIAVEAEDLAACDSLILGTSTWREAGLQYDWEFYIDLFDDIDLKGKKVAIFGLGDQKNYPANFADAMADLYDRVVERGAEVVGAWPTEGYTFTASRSVRDGRFIGLVIDELNQRDLTDERIASWAGQLKKEF